MKKYFFISVFTLFTCCEASRAQTNPPDTNALNVPAPVVASGNGTTSVAPELENEPSAVIEYKAQVISTNFTIPIIRFNIIDKKSTGAPTDRKGNVSFFNSIGAGIGYYWGRITDVTDKDGKVINSEMNNTFGVQLGFLFAANSSGSNNSNIFALTAGISLLNFQLGYGYEFGTIGANDKRGFMTLAYGIPVSKLIKGGFYTVKKSSALTAEQKKRGFSKIL